MDHLDISYIVDSIDACRVAGVSNTDVSSNSDFLIWYMERPLRILVTKIFDLTLLIVGVFLTVY